MTIDTDSGKSPVEPTDYAGLQLDTRPTMERDQYMGAYKPGTLPEPYRSTWRSEKLVYAITDDGAKNGHLYPPNYRFKEELPTPSLLSNPKPSRRCHSRNRVLLGVGFLVPAIIAGAILGGIFGSRRMSQNSNVAVTPTEAPSIINAGLPQSYVMVDSPLAPIAFQSNESGQSGTVPLYRLYYQSAFGNAKEMIKDGGSSQWQTAHPILTDLHNNSGIAVINYANKSLGGQPQSAIYYIGNDFLIWEKRQAGNDWYPGSLSALKVSVQGSSSTAEEGGWNGFRLAAAATKDGARLFYHASNGTDNWVQELIWSQSNDSWIQGTGFYDVDPNSHFTATMEGASNTLRFFYVTTSNTLTERWLNLSSSESEYKAGIKLPSILAHLSTDISAVSTENSTFLYFSSATPSASNITINELTLPLLPELSHTSVDVLAIPALLASDTGNTLSSKFAPLGAVFAPFDGNGTITVFWAEGVVDQRSGYAALKAVSRRVGDKWGAANYGQTENMVDLPLGNENDAPHRR